MDNLSPSFSGSIASPILTAANAVPGGIAAALAILGASGLEFACPLFEAVRRDEIAVTIARPHHSLPLRRLDAAHRPAVVILGDDSEGTRLGPSGWPHAHQGMRWAAGAVLHGAAGERRHYEKAIAGAKEARRIVLVETSSWRIPEWEQLALRYMAPSRILKILPSGGRFHPEPAVTGGVQ